MMSEAEATTAALPEAAEAVVTQRAPEVAIKTSAEAPNTDAVAAVKAAVSETALMKDDEPKYVFVSQFKSLVTYYRDAEGMMVPAQFKNGVFVTSNEAIARGLRKAKGFGLRYKETGNVATASMRRELSAAQDRIRTSSMQGADNSMFGNEGMAAQQLRALEEEERKLMQQGFIDADV